MQDLHGRITSRKAAAFLPGVEQRPAPKAYSAFSAFASGCVSQSDVDSCLQVTTLCAKIIGGMSYHHLPSIANRFILVCYFRVAT